jgi:glucan phosphoethanolaminetransferase (alkaline phosphatase superfamily)
VERKIKIYWLVIILVSILAIFFIVHTTFANDDLVKYIGFAGTVVSIILGVIAIFYSIVTNNQSTENLGKLKEAVSKVEDAAKVIKDVSVVINEKVDAIKSQIEFGTKDKNNQVLPKSTLKTEVEPVADPTADQQDPMDDE